MEPITITYSSTQEDYRSSTKELAFAQNANPFKAELILLGFWGLTTTINLIFLPNSVDSDGFQTLWFATGIILLVFLLSKINQVFNRPHLPNKLSNPGWFSPITITLDDEGFSAISHTGDSRVYWNMLRAFKETKGYVFIKFLGTSDYYYISIPNHAFESKEQKQLVIDLLAGKMQGRVNDTKHF